MKKFITILSIFVIAFISTFYALQNVIPSFAQLTPANVSIDPVVTNTGLNQNITVQVRINNVTNLGGYQFTLNFDPQVIKISSITNSDWLASTGRTVGPLSSIDNTNGIATAGAFSFGTTNGPSGDNVLATINLTTVGLGSSALDLQDVLITDISAQTINTIATDGSINILAASPTPVASITPVPTPVVSPTPIATPIATPVASVSPNPSTSPSTTPTPTGSASATLSLALPSPLVFVGEDFSVDLKLDTNASITGADAIILFDPAQLTAVNVIDKKLLPTTPKIDINNGNGTISISQVADPGTPFIGSGTMAQLVFRSLGSVGNRTLRFDYVPGVKTESNVIASIDGKDILAQPLDLTLTVIDHAYLTVKLLTPSENATLGHTLSGLLSDTESTWSSQINTDVSGTSANSLVDNSFIGQLKTFLFKASTFLRRRSALNIASGDNVLDLGALKAGDLNNDGIVNNLDLSLMYDQWFLSGTADFDRNNVVNTSDYWILTQNFLQVDE
ncbi:MAG: Ig domain protein group 2 domain protein [Parcubacteria group bacterium GW2011_GWA1_36_12]|nr:MAG: Ig domain protein group 2 domain protein [Parcubacteria group bacterium GW2011_GWA1_36_12]